MEESNRPKFLENYIHDIAPGEVESVSAYADQKEQERLHAEQEHGYEIEKTTREQKEKQMEYERLRDELKKLKDALDFYNNNFFKKFGNYIQYRRTVDSFSNVSGEVASAERDLADITDKLKALQEVSFDRTEIEAIEQELRGFQRDLEASWDSAPFEKEDMERDFDTEHLNSLSLEDYVKLLKRYPQDMLTHVTRQGLRDHAGFIYHSAGLGAVHEGMKTMLVDKKLHSVISSLVAQHGKEGAVAAYLDLDSCATRDQAEEMYSTKFDSEFADRSAVHFAVSEVADDLYGGEKGNEVFVAYPSVYVASQMHHEGQIAGKNSGQRNDVYAWNKDVGGMDIDAGIVFLPKDAQVDPETGSQYMLEQGKGIVSEKNKSDLERILTSDVFASTVDELLEFNRIKEKREINTLAEERERAKKAGALAERIVDELGGVGQDLKKILLDHDLIRELNHYVTYLRQLGENVDDTQMADEYKKKWLGVQIHIALMKHALMYERAKDTVPSEEYWESYFDDHPEKRPSKVVYYEADDPTKALQDFLVQNGLGKQSKNSDERFGFANTSVETMRSSGEFEELKIIARKMIDDTFSDNDNNV